jgi:hypothetical protein
MDPCLLVVVGSARWHPAVSVLMHQAPAGDYPLQSPMTINIIVLGQFNTGCRLLLGAYYGHYIVCLIRDGRGIAYAPGVPSFIGQMFGPSISLKPRSDMSGTVIELSEPAAPLLDHFPR